MPQIPEGKHRPNMQETVVDLLESIALEEMAIGHVLNAEGEKLQAIVHKLHCCEIDIATMTMASRGINQTIVDLIMKEWLLLLKFGYVTDFVREQGVFPPAPAPAPTPNPPPLGPCPYFSPEEGCVKNIPSIEKPPIPPCPCSPQAAVWQERFSTCRPLCDHWEEENS